MSKRDQSRKRKHRSRQKQIERAAEREQRAAQDDLTMPEREGRIDPKDTRTSPGSEPWEGKKSLAFLTGEEKDSLRRISAVQQALVGKKLGVAVQSFHQPIDGSLDREEQQAFSEDAEHVFNRWMVSCTPQEHKLARYVAFDGNLEASKRAAGVRGCPEAALSSALAKYARTFRRYSAYQPSTVELVNEPARNFEWDKDAVGTEVEATLIKMREAREKRLTSEEIQNT